MNKSIQEIAYFITILLTFVGNRTFSQQNNALPPIPIMSTIEFTNAVEQNDLNRRLKKSYDPQFAKEYLNSELTTSPTIRIANGMLINIPHPWSPDSDPVYVLNANRTSSFISRRLFSDNVKMDIEGLYLSTNPDNTIAFHLDYYWDRIAYSQKSGNWIKSYGDHPGEYKSLNAKGMAVDILDTIYVADSDNNRIVKLRYNRSTSMIDFISSFSIAGMVHPIDIAIDQSSSLSGDSLRDRIWIADDFGRRLIEINRSGAVTRQIINCDPFKVQTQEIGGRLAFCNPKLH